MMTETELVAIEQILEANQNVCGYEPAPMDDYCRELLADLRELSKAYCELQQAYSEERGN